ncbi:unnamed protein product [Calypogeia fissa]
MADKASRILLAFYLLLALAITGPACRADARAIAPEGFTIWNNMGSGELLYTYCQNNVTGDVILDEQIAAGVKSLFDINVLDYNFQPSQSIYSCVFNPISSSTTDERQISRVVWAIGSNASLMPQVCALCAWMISDDGLSIRDNSTPLEDYKIIEHWQLPPST